VVSPQVAQDMARAARDRMGADLGIGITGVSGPSEMEGNPVGTVHIGLAHPGGIMHFSSRYPSQRSLVKQRANTQTLIQVWNLLKQMKDKRDQEAGA